MKSEYLKEIDGDLYFYVISWNVRDGMVPARIKVDRVGKTFVCGRDGVKFSFVTGRIVGTLFPGSSPSLVKPGSPNWFSYFTDQP